MCSCSLKYLPYGSISIKALRDNQQLRQQIMEKHFIPEKAFLNKDTSALFKFIFCMSPDSFKRAFAPYQIEVNDFDDVAALAGMHDGGIDKTQFNVDFFDLVENVNIPATDLDKKDSCVVFVKD